MGEKKEKCRECTAELHGVKRRNLTWLTPRAIIIFSFLERYEEKIILSRQNYYNFHRATGDSKYFNIHG